MAKGDDDSRPVNLTMGSARKLKRVVDKVDGKGPPAPAPSRGGGGWTPSIVRAKVTTAIPTGSFASPSSAGKAQIYYLVDGTWTADETVTVYNDKTLSSSIPVGRAVNLAWICGTWWLNIVSCS